ncbi:MAG: hypothetical protein RIT47_903 [Pseudomonadota bacterium]|jgi:hypothetical protein
MTTYAIKVDTLNLSKSFIYFEDENLTYSQAQDRLKDYQNRFNDFIKKGIVPTLIDDRQRELKITKMSIVPKV